MSLGDADHGEMHLFRRRLRAELLDDPTAERLLRGQVDPDDAPPGYAGVAGVLRAAAAELVVTDSSAEDQAVAAFAATAWVRDASPVEPKRRFVVPIPSMRNKVAAVAAGLGLALTGGLSAAGALPGAAQDVAHDVLGTMGISVPDPNTNAGDHPDTRGDHADAQGEPSPVSAIARTTTATGVDKGAEISTLASQGQSRAGTQPNAPAAGPPSSIPPHPTPPVSTPAGPPSSVPPHPTPPVSTPAGPPSSVPPHPTPPVSTPAGPPSSVPPHPTPPVSTTGGPS